MRYLLIICLFFKLVLVAQETPKANPKRSKLVIELAAAYNIPFKSNYFEIRGDYKSCYWEYEYKKYSKMTYIGSVGYRLELSQLFYLESKLNYQYLTSKSTREGFTTGATCSPVVPGFTESIFTAEYHLIGISEAIGLKYKRFVFENNIGAHVWNHYHFFSHTYNIKNPFIFDKSKRVNYEFTFQTFSTHKLGYSFLKDRLALLIGLHLNHTNHMTKSFAPLISLKYLL